MVLTPENDVFVDWVLADSFEDLEEKLNYLQMLIQRILKSKLARNSSINTKLLPRSIF